MIVRITRLLLCLQLFVALVVGVAAYQVLDAGPLASALLGLAPVVLLRVLINANNFLLSWRFRSETPPGFRLNLLQATRLFLGEFKASMLSSSWTMPFLSFSKRIAPKPAGLPVLLVHGYGCNSGYWHSLSKALQRANVTHHAVDMEPIGGSIDHYAPLLESAVQRLCAETGSARAIIVAHSMGGLAARAHLRKFGLGRVAKLITLGTPHRGTGLAQYGVGLNCEQMRWTADGLEGVCSEWLRELAAGEDETSYRSFVSIYSHHDNIVSPQTSSHLPGAVNIEVGGIGHVALAFHPTVHKHVLAEILKTPN